jgi:hypothetical protein
MNPEQGKKNGQMSKQLKTTMKLCTQEDNMLPLPIRIDRAGTLQIGAIIHASALTECRLALGKSPNKT